MQNTTIRIELARNRMTVKDLMAKTGIARETINSALDGDYSHSKVSTLKRIEAALPNLRLVVQFEIDESDTQ